MSFSTFSRRVLIGWLRDCEEDGRPVPGDRAIMTRLNFGSVALAGDILAELAAEGLIAIDGSGADRKIRVLVAPGVQVGSAKSIPQGASGTARKAPSASVSADASRSIARAPISTPAPDMPAPPPDPVPQVAPLPAVPAEAETARAKAPSQRVEAPHPAFAKGRKPFISADIIRAARERDQPLDVFVTALLNIGFAEWRQANGWRG
ncbi:hypothetical protein [Sphingomonas nostoxanthinifaciens]|uniref:hypothetical protein n=1 Tax=Sphingomonas nostoxanthinifaciens TaxID=2872652 RepID=UPI001CC2200A|nr:hypothetical protein [Sphingomonas nostoxanthinifaciens]UAK24202.1 hypothetical protein K8P63_18025 [Sphingomonas nostoxanthinifaciens]